ncbi:ABC transporter ATP-binding protein [Natronolimnohabitans innermongolicus]|uniref:Molybdate/tungstate import ATP-binding protein WtpC n=1 Tax=Natronolimnohabitans innermongolicus JCM 12255 TaxID=1227499 RepID=L9WLP1_9EURY|nr:ABC transporter ATP-binding protein [Natronolimnohabitans innermongolicus]ELY50384.1 polyamine-transporting ATPase [Natronolimnohabitans innermongolicus JCM 12255]
MLEVKNLTKYYGDLLAVDDVSFRIEEGEFATLLGPSGCGKSTTLHAIAGLIDASSGSVHLRGKDVSDVAPYERNIGLVFQHSALFPHMTVEENLRYGLKMQNFDGDHDDQVQKYLEMVQMADHADHKPDELSGGQQRRISFARALVYEPDILLLDEPLTGLDRVLREDMRNEIRSIQQEVDVTTLHVTHDQSEALSMSDRVIVMNDGRKEQVGHPTELYERPETEFVAEFLGQSTKFQGELVDSPSPIVQAGSREIHVKTNGRFDPADGEEVSTYIRPEEITVYRSPQANGDVNTFTGTVRDIEYLGHRAELEIELGDGTVVTAFSQTSDELDIDDEVAVQFDPEKVICV